MNASTEIRIRDHRVPGWYWSQNEVIDQIAGRGDVYGIAVYHVLARLSRNDKVSGVSAGTIAKILKCSRAQVFRSLSALESVGALVREAVLGYETNYFLVDLKPPTSPPVSTRDWYASGNPSKSEPRGTSGRARTRLNKPLANKEVKLQDCKTELPPTPLLGGESSPMFQGLYGNSWSLILERLKTELASTSAATKLPDEYDRFFRDSWQIGLQRPSVIILDAENPELAKQGILRYQRRIEAIGLRVFGQPISAQIGLMSE